MASEKTAQDGSGAGMDSAELLKTLLSNEHIPEGVKKQLWALFSHTVKLTFLTEKDVQTYLLKWKLIRLAIIKSIPKSAYDDAIKLELLNVGIEYESNIRKSLGAKMNYIELITAEIRATFDERPLGVQSSNNVSFVKRLTNAVTGK